jgi:hypothetical protein
MIRETDSLISRPIIYADGQLKHEEGIIVPSNMDRMYLKLETTNDKIVRFLFL